MDKAKTAGHWMREALFPNRYFKPLVERSSRSTLTNPHIWGFCFNHAIYGGCLPQLINYMGKIAFLKNQNSNVFVLIYFWFVNVSQ
jgi:hypothetical protein